MSQPERKEEQKGYPDLPIIFGLPSDGSIHNASGFCYNPDCPCHEDQELTNQLEQHRLNGEVSKDDITRIFNGKTVW